MKDPTLELLAVLPGTTLAKLLVVDDDPSIRRAVAALFEPRGHEVLEAANGLDALVVLSADLEVGLVLADVQLARVDGLALLELIRRYHPEIVVVLMAADATVDAAIAAMKAGAYDYLAKPVSLARLERVVERALGAGISVSSGDPTGA